MADYQAVSNNEGLRLQVQRMIDNLYVAMPVKVIAFSAATQKVTVQPLTKMKITLGEEVTYVNFPVLSNIPVIIPFCQTLNLAITLPIKAGDTGIILVMDKSLEAFLQTGNVSAPPLYSSPKTATPRCHDLTDSIYIPGLSSNKKLVKDYSVDSLEIRTTDDDKTKVTINGNFIQLAQNYGKNTVKMGGRNNPITVTSDSDIYIKGKNIHLTAEWTGEDGSGKVLIDSENIRLTDKGNYIDGSLQSHNGTFIDKDGVNLNAHTHTGVESGNSTTGSPVK